MTLLASEPQDDTDSLSSLSDDVLSNFDGMDNSDNRHSFGGTETPLSSSPSPSSSRLEGLSESIRSTHEKLANGSLSNQLGGAISSVSSSNQNAQPDRQHQAIAPLTSHTSRPLLSASLDHDGTEDPDAEGVESSQPNTPRLAGRPVLSKEWTIPPRPKPGRKPATDIPTSKRREQNRVAQRAYRERGKIALEKYEKESKVKEDAHQRELEAMRADLNQCMATANHYKTQCEHYKSSLAEMSGQCHTLQAEINMFQHQLREEIVEKESLRRENEALRRPRIKGLGTFSGHQTPYSSGSIGSRNGQQNGIYPSLDDLYSNTVTHVGANGRCVSCNDLARTCACLEETQKRHLEDFIKGSSKRPSLTLPSPPIVDDRRFSLQDFSSTQRPGMSNRGSYEQYPVTGLSRAITNTTDNLTTVEEKPNLGRLNTKGTDYSDMEIDLTSVGRKNNADPDLPSATVPEKEDCGFCTDTFRGPGGIDCLCRVAKDGPAPSPPILDAVPLKRKPSAAPTRTEASSSKKRPTAPVPNIERATSGIKPGSCHQCQLDPNSRKFCIEAAAKSQRIELSQHQLGAGGSSTAMKRTKSCDEVYREVSQHPNIGKGLENPRPWLSELKTSPSTDSPHAQIVDAASVLCCFKALDNMTDADWEAKS